MNNELVQRIRQVIDGELDGMAWTMKDKEGHVELVDGDVDTLAIAQAVEKVIAS